MNITRNIQVFIIKSQNENQGERGDGGGVER